MQNIITLSNSPIAPLKRVSPMRMNLLARKRQLVIAKQGADLLRKKRAIGVLSLALGYDGPEALRSSALSDPRT